MKIFVDVGEAAERLEELVELAFRGDDIFVCRDERAVAQLSAFTQEGGLFATETAVYIAGVAHSGKLSQAVHFCSIDVSWTRAIDGKASSNQDVKSKHDAVSDTDGLPK